jgi:hypothetical protein
MCGGILDGVGQLDALHFGQLRSPARPLRNRQSDVRLCRNRQKRPHFGPILRARIQWVKKAV